MGELDVRSVLWVLAATIILGGGAGAATVQVKAGDAVPDDAGCGSGANPCDTIQAGVDNAAAGDVVNVGKGDYLENVVVATAGIRLRGSGALLGDAFPACDGPAGLRVQAARCGELLTQNACESAWYVDETGLLPNAASCYWDGVACALCEAATEAAATCTNACVDDVPASLEVRASGVAIEKLRVRGARFAGISVAAEGAGATIRGVRVEGSGSACIAVAAENVAVASSTLRACGGDGIAAEAGGAALTKNRISGAADSGIRLQGQAAVLQRNSITLADADCLRFDGDTALVDRNRLSLCGQQGVDGRGTSLRVLKNTVRGASEGLAVDCRSFPTSCADASRTGLGTCALAGSQPDCEALTQQTPSGVVSCYWDGNCSPCNLNAETNLLCTDTCLAVPGERCIDGFVTGNRVNDAVEGGCFQLDAVDPGLVAEANQGLFCAGAGIELDGEGVVLRNNDITDSGRTRNDHGVEIGGVSHLIDGNVVRRAFGDGFHVEATAENVILSENQAFESGEDGFDVEALAAGTVLEGDLASNNVEGGIEVSLGALNTVVAQSRGSSNLLDFCDEGTATTVTANQFGTSGAFCTPD